MNIKVIVTIAGLMVMTGCGLMRSSSTIEFSENKATLSGTKANAKINIEKKEAEIFQIGVSFWERLFLQRLQIKEVGK